MFTPEPGVALPALLFVPHKRLPADQGGALTIVVGDDPGEDLEPGGLVDRVVRGGQPVLILGLRGMGETTPDGKGSPFGADWKEAFLSLHLARPLLGQRVGKEHSGGQRRKPDRSGFDSDVFPHRTGESAPVVAAPMRPAIDPRIKIVTLDQLLTTWSGRRGRPWSRATSWRTWFLALLAYYDLPDLAAADSGPSADDPTRRSIREGRPVSKEKPWR